MRCIIVFDVRKPRTSRNIAEQIQNLSDMRDFRVGPMREFAQPEIAQTYGNRLEIAAEAFDLGICQPRQFDDIDGVVLKMRPKTIGDCALLAEPARRFPSLIVPKIDNECHNRQQPK